MGVEVTEVGPAKAPAGPSPWRVAARLAWMAIRLILILCLGERGVLFFYQGF
jgi:hypothetical protein